MTDGAYAVAEKLSAEAIQIIEALPVDGATSGNLRLRERLGMDPERYREAAVEFKTLGLVIAGRGRGGSLALSETSTEPGASFVLSAFTQAWISLRRIAPIGRAPRVGYAWRRR